MRIPARTLALLALAASATGLLGGCYRRVVRATGPGAESYEIHEANIGEDESVWSQPKPKVIERDPMVAPTAQPKKQPGSDD